jgi:hypothetical protein
MTKCIALLTLLPWMRPATARAQAPMETETARFSPRGVLQAEAVFEYQTSPDGRESALPFAVEYSITDRLSLLAEPVPFTQISPVQGFSARGPGDLEVTLTGLLMAEARRRPAFAVAGEVKVPTGEAPLIGSDRFDYTGYIIASKRLGRLDLHANLGYTIVGHPTGVAVNNTVDFALASEVTLDRRWQALAEILGNTSAIPEHAGTESPTTPEISTGELTGMIGLRYALGARTVASMGVTLDTSGAVLLRPGIAMKF